MLLTLFFTASTAFMESEAQHARYYNQIDTDQVRDVSLLIPYHDPILQDYSGERAKIRDTLFENTRKQEDRKRLHARRRAIDLSRDGLILEGILDLPRLKETGPIDGCTKVHKGLTNSGGFLLFTCEKLLPSIAIEQHESVADRYAAELLKASWTRAEAPDDTAQLFTLTDETGCEQSLKLMVWTDRSLNEERPLAPTRDDFRQIVFLTKFSGEACERYYPVVQALAAQ